MASYGLAEGLSHKGHDVDFIVPYRDSHDIDFMNVVNASPYSSAELRVMGGAYDSALYQEYINQSTGRPGGVDLRGQQKFFSEFVRLYAKNNEFDVIHAHEWLTFEAGVAAKLASGKPLIAHVHATEFDRSGEHYGNPVVHEIEEYGLLMADRIIAVSRHTKNVIVKNYHIPASKVEVLHNGINSADYMNFDDRPVYEYVNRMKDRGYKVVTNIGRLTTQKGLNYLLRAFAEVVRLEPKTLLLVVGNGEMYHELIGLSAELGVSKNTLFTGFQRGKKLRDAFSVSDVFVMPSVSEPFGIAPLEAASYNVPVVLSKTSGVAEVLKSSFSVDYYDTHEMADRIVSLLRHESLRREMSQNARKEFEGLTWFDVAAKCQAIYGRIFEMNSRLGVGA